MQILELIGWITMGFVPTICVMAFGWRAINKLYKPPKMQKKLSIVYGP